MAKRQTVTPVFVIAMWRKKEAESGAMPRSEEEAQKLRHLNYDETILRKHLSKWRNKAGVALGVIGTAILGRRIDVILGFIAAGIWLWQSADPVFWHTVVNCVIVGMLAVGLTFGFAVGLQFIGNITMDCMMADVLRDDHAKRSWNAINYGKGFEENQRAEFLQAIKQLCEK